MTSKSRIVLLSLLLAIVSVGLGVVIGYFSHPSEEDISLEPKEDVSIKDKLKNSMKSESIREHLRYFTKRPHIAGRDVDEVDLVNYIKDKWTEYGVDSIVTPSYNVLLSYPKQNDSNYVAVVLNDGSEIDISQRKELVIDEEQNDPDVVDPFNAYSAAGEPVGDLVYVNYGTIEDFMLLNRTLDIETEGNICISRYGRIFRGDKAKHAEQYGCIGLILYSDPADYTVPWTGVYPDSWYLPGTGVQRGTLKPIKGDPRTPNYPSTDTAWHQPEESLILPKIPVTPIGYIDGVKYLRRLGGKEVEDNWKGGLNITYRYGPGFSAPDENSKMKMSVKTTNQEKKINNIIGYIRGSYEPDRYVLFGNHRDAWVFGAIDPSSGTAALMELVRAFGEMVKGGWRPRRTLVFCSWAAEEFGIIGSTEWVEEFQKELQARAVAYINVDIAVAGNHTLESAGVYSLSDVVFNAAQAIDNPSPAEVAEGRKSVYDTWIMRLPSSIFSSEPRFSSLGSGSDYVMFQQSLGISSIDLHYAYDRGIGLASYPVYHSIYETFELVSKYVDPDFTYHLALAQVWGEIGRKLADSQILPFDCRQYAMDLDEKRKNLEKNYGERMTTHGIDLNQLQQAISTFSDSAKQLHQRIDSLNRDDVSSVRMINDQLMLLERAFIDQNPLLGRVLYRHVISAPSQHNNYGTTAFPGIVDSMFDIDDDDEESWNEVRRQYSIVIFHILSAATTLEPVVPEN